MKDHILIVEDELPICDLLRAFFQRRGYDVTAVHDAAAAAERIQAGEFHLLILDILLPDGDGMELLEKAQERHPDLPVIIMTGIGFDEELLREARRKGASGYVSKTLPLDQLLMEVHRVLKHPK